MPGQFKRIHDLDEVTVVDPSDRFVLDTDLNGTDFKTNQIQFSNLKSAILSGGNFGLLLETGDNLLLESGGIFLLENSASGVFENIVQGPGLTLELNNYYRITSAGTYTLPSASTSFDGTTEARIKIKNVSGGIITIQADGTDDMYSTNASPLISSFDLSDGEMVTLIAGDSTTWDIT